MVSLFLMVSVFAVYWQVRHHEFIILDDDDYITKNRHVQAGWTMESLGWAFTTRLHRHWHPLTWLSHMTDCQFFGLDAGWHHLSSVFLHVANTLLLFFVFRRMTGALFRSAFVAALFALHPLHVEPVAWVASRKDVLSAFFWMLTMWVYVGYAERPGFTRYVLVLIGFILGLMAKSMVVTMPVVLLLMDYWPLERFDFRQSGGKGQPKKRQGLHARYQKAAPLRLIWEKALFFFIIAACGVVAVVVIQSTFNPNVSKYLPTKLHMVNSLVYYVSYIGMMLYPINLATPYPDQAVAPLWQVSGAGLLLLGICTFVVWQRRRHPYLLVGWLWYLITLAPVIGLVRFGPHKLADRYTYIPLIGLFVIFAWGLPGLVKGWRYRRMALAMSTGLLLPACMMGAWLQVRHWQDSISLFKHTVHVTADNAMAHNNLGVSLSRQGRFEEAIHHYSEALRIKPDYVKAHNNLGLRLAAQGRLEEAIHHYSEALRMQPDYAEAHNNMGAGLAEQGRLEEAIRHFSEALKIKPDYAEAHNNMGAGLAEQGRLEGAIRHFSEALKIKPGYERAQRNLKFSLQVMGKSP